VNTLTSLQSSNEMEALRRDHPTLPAGLAFLDGASSWGARELIAWFDEAFVTPGYMDPPTIVADPAFGTAPLHRAIRPQATRPVRVDDVPLISARARVRVIEALRGFIGRPSDDRFLQAAIFAERVQRVRLDRTAIWAPSPKEIDALANIALSLFVADILTHREFFEANLCVCDVCGQVSFEREVTTRRGCRRHTPRTESTSGFHSAATPDDDD
jgi:hypothetical protein